VEFDRYCGVNVPKVPVIDVRCGIGESEL
jgi:hypothetical protein